jgi:hypothetical protein
MNPAPLPADVVSMCRVVAQTLGCAPGAESESEVLHAAVMQACAELEVVKAAIDDQSELAGLVDGICARLYLAAEFGATLSEILKRSRS